MKIQQILILRRIQTKWFQKAKDHETRKYQNNRLTRYMEIYQILIWKCFQTKQFWKVEDSELESIKIPFTQLTKYWKSLNTRFETYPNGFGIRKSSDQKASKYQIAKIFQDSRINYFKAYPNQMVLISKGPSNQKA